MATRKRATVAPKHQLSIAAFCTKVLEGNDGIMSGIRFLDHCLVPVAADRDPEKREAISLWALVAFKSSNFEGEHVLRLVLRTPTSKKILLGECPMKFESPVTSFNYRIKVDLKIKTQGLYWTDVILDGRRYTSMPLRISFQSVLPRQVL